MKTKKIVVLTGAGMSAESGFSTFRDSGGLWEKYPVEQVATPEGWNDNPDLVTDFYNGLRKQLADAQPNEGHRLLAKLEEYYDVVVVTQNVDNLHERAGSSRVIHLHGELTKVTSSRDPENPEFVRTLGENETLCASRRKSFRRFAAASLYRVVRRSRSKMEEAVEEARNADIFIVIGTSLNVYPAAGLINYVPRTAPIYVIDPKTVKISNSPRIRFLETTATKGMQVVFDELTR